MLFFYIWFFHGMKGKADLSVVSRLATLFRGIIPIISNGNIITRDDVQTAANEGTLLVQLFLLYSSFLLFRFLFLFMPPVRFFVFLTRREGSFPLHSHFLLSFFLTFFVFWLTLISFFIDCLLFSHCLICNGNSFYRKFFMTTANIFIICFQ